MQTKANQLMQHVLFTFFACDISRGCNPFEILIRSVVLLSGDSKIIPFGVQIQWEGFRRIQTFTRAVQI